MAMLVYVWSRRSPQVRVNFFGLLTFQAPFLPWALMGFSLLLGNSIIVDLLGELACPSHPPGLILSLGPMPQGPLICLLTPLPVGPAPHQPASWYTGFASVELICQCPSGPCGGGMHRQAPAPQCSLGLPKTYLLPACRSALELSGTVQGGSVLLSHRDCCGSHLLLPRGCFPQPAWRQETAANPWLPVSVGDDSDPSLR